jgi:hypothetical protein
MLEWIEKNRDWVFSGVGVFAFSLVMGVIVKLLRRPRSTSPDRHITTTNEGFDNSGVFINQSHVSINSMAAPSAAVTPTEDSVKSNTHILFIDDDTKFKVVDILKKSGWVHTQRVSDVGSIDDDRIQRAHIFFIDINGVGKKLQFRDEGLGLSKAIKTKYPTKKVVIYSAQSEGDRFHEALRQADDFLPKNADPYEFQQLTEKLAREIFADK